MTTDPLRDYRVDFDLTTPAYQQIAQHLRDAIQTGVLPPGARVPSETALQRHYGVAKQTVRSALAVLHTEGVTAAQHGRGVFVTALPDPDGPQVRGPLSVGCPECLAEAGQSCYATSSDLPRRAPHRLRRIVAAKQLTACPHCQGLGFVPASEIP